MKAKAIILFASVLLTGCQTSKHSGNLPEQHGQSLSSAKENGKNRDQLLSTHWQDDGTSLSGERDLWTFIGDELKMEVPENDRIREQKQKYLRNKSYLHDVTLRAEPYMYWIIEQIKQQDMPMELVLLPIVESAFDPHATSAADAAGIWQIVPSTGRNYGLKQDRWYDGRRDIMASTKVALNLMRRLNRMFDGDWLLTIAAYNSGEGRVLNAIKQNKAQGKPTDFWSLSLPKETTVYIPKMLALSNILKNNRRYGVRLPTPDENRGLASVDVGQQIKLAQVAEMSGISLDTIRDFNPGYKGDMTAPAGPHYIMVPKSHIAKLRTSLASGEVTTTNQARLARNSLSQNVKYTVQSGDTLSGIASKLGVPVKKLQDNNGLHRGGLKPGQVLNVPTTGIQLASSRRNSIEYQVRKGDSLSSIAQRHGVNVKDIKRWNSVPDGSNLHSGDTLTLYVANNIKPDS